MGASQRYDDIAAACNDYVRMYVVYPGVPLPGVLLTTSLGCFFCLIYYCEYVIQVVSYRSTVDVTDGLGPTLT